MPGSEQPGFLEVQRAFAAHIRNPALNPPPRDIEARRMRIYVDLFHRNIRHFLDRGFPLARSVLAPAVWQDLVCGFIDRHASETPYFPDIGQEFLAFLDEDAALDVPEWLIELCHYEWVKRSLRTAGPELPVGDVDPDGDLLDRQVVVSTLIRPLCYRYRVHEIRPGKTSAEPAAGPAWLIACRRRDDAVKVIVSNALTHRLVEHLVPEATGNDALSALSEEFPEIDPQRLRREGAAILERLRDAQVLLGVRC